MTSAYPGTPPGSAQDVFTVPSEPEGTPLSSGGGTDRNHTELHDAEGAAIEQLEAWAALRIHDHSGDSAKVDKGAKLDEANTHQHSDTDTAPTARHHTIGTGPNQVASGSHTHTAATVVQYYQVCTSTTRPTSPFLGLTIFETDTNYQRVWSRVGGVTDWHITPLVTPTCRLQQDVKQNLVQGGTNIEWHTVLEDNNSFFNPAASLSAIHIEDGGLYHIDAAVQWNTDKVPDTCFMAITVNGAETTLREHRFQRGENFIPGFSQTLSTSGKYRLKENDVVRVKVDFTASQGLLGAIFTFFQQLTGQATYSKVTSRIELAYLGP